MDPVTVICSAACTVTHVISVPPFDMSTGDASLIAAAVVAVWAVGFGFRVVIRALNVDGVKPESE